MIPIASPKTKDLAALYKCSTRTVIRLRKSGVDVCDPAAVAEAMAAQKIISIPMAHAVIAQLETTESND